MMESDLLLVIDTIKRCFETAEKLGNAIPAISPTESLRMITEQGSLPVNRLNVKQIQTPQVFNTELIKNAYLNRNILLNLLMMPLFLKKREKKSILLKATGKI